MRQRTRLGQSPARVRRLAKALSAGLLLATGAADAASGPLAISVGRLPCRSRTAVEAALREKVRPERPDEGLVLLVDAPSPGRLRVRLARGEDAVERTMRFSRADCAELPKTVSALVDAWLARIWPAVPPAPAPEPAAAQSPEPPRVVVMPRPAPPPPAPPPVRDGVTAGLFAGAFWGGSGQGGASAGLQLDASLDAVGALARRDWGLVALAWTETPLSFETRSGGTPQARHLFELAAMPRYSLWRGPAARIDVAAGPALLVLRRSGAFVQAANGRGLDVALVGALRGAFALGEDWSVVASGGFHLRSQIDEYKVDRDEPNPSRENPLRALFAVGVAYRAF